MDTLNPVSQTLADMADEICLLAPDVPDAAWERLRLIAANIRAAATMVGGLTLPDADAPRAYLAGGVAQGRA